NENFVLSLGVEMEQRRWQPAASDIVFDENGALIDGHHRLSAVVALGKAMQFAVKRGVPAEVRNVIDTGRKRNMGDLLTMYRDVDSGTGRRAALNVCVDLLVGIGRDRHKKPLINSLPVFDAWMRPFQEGIDWAVRATYGVGNPRSATKGFFRGAVL